MDLRSFLRRHVVDEVWRPGERRINVRKQRPGLGWTVNLWAVRERLRRRG
jgi:hypothetical protein